MLSNIKYNRMQLNNVINDSIIIVLGVISDGHEIIRVIFELS